MSRFYKISLFASFLLISGAFFLYFSPVSKKEIHIEEITGAASENNIESEQKGGSPEENNKNEIIENQLKLPPEKEISETSKDKSPSNSVEIIQKSVSWGYSQPPSARNIDTIIVHSSYNALGGDKYDLAKLIEEYKEYGVSPHYLIDREGHIYQLISDKNVAYHAGESKLPDGRTDINDFSLGIELMNTEKSSPTEKQYLSLKKLLNYIKNSYKIKYVLGHDQIAPGRKTDPWNFDWKKL